jgi:hypothetical protein
VIVPAYRARYWALSLRSVLAQAHYLEYPFGLALDYLQASQLEADSAC